MLVSVKIIVRSPTGMKRDYVIPTGAHPVIYKGDQVVAGQQLIEGPVVLQDILRVCGDKVLQERLVTEVQEIYRLQGVRINDKHIEVIIREMLKKVKVDDGGDSDFLPGEGTEKRGDEIVAIKFGLSEENNKLIKVFRCLEFISREEEIL